MSRARGKYVQFLDGDDYFEPQMLETLYNLAEKNSADIAVCSSRKVDDEGNVTETGNPNSPLNLSKLTLNKVYNYKDYPDNVFTLINSAPWNKLYLREMLTKNNLNFPKLTGPDDLCFVYMATVCAERIIAINKELINYRFNRPGSAQTYRANSAINIIRVAMYLKEFLEKKGLYDYLENAYKQAMNFSVRWETNLCNDEQYENFLKQLKSEFPNDWKLFSSALRKDFITLEYLYNFIGNRNVYLWGASNFIKNLLEKEENVRSNILGIIDKNEASWGKDFCGYKIFSPEVLKTHPADVLVTIYNNYEIVHSCVKKEIQEKGLNINVLDNIFIGE